ncbi:hypothetical protein BTZ20_4140 [Rhodococcus sp. MTM3W5.2]|nr:hypothetical protein BTZ20_4140 [Rhodococcus sp. MTM3W5.2]
MRHGTHLTGRSRKRTWPTARAGLAPELHSATRMPSQPRF